MCISDNWQRGSVSYIVFSPFSNFLDPPVSHASKGRNTLMWKRVTGNWKKLKKMCKITLAVAALVAVTKQSSVSNSSDCGACIRLSIERRTRRLCHCAIVQRRSETAAAAAAAAAARSGPCRPPSVSPEACTPTGIDVEHFLQPEHGARRHEFGRVWATLYISDINRSTCNHFNSCTADRCPPCP